MTLREFFLQRLKAEAPVMKRVLEALPADRLDYTPHERSQSAEKIVWTIASEFKVCVDVVATARGEWVALPAQSLAEMVALFDRSVADLITRVEQADEALWSRQAQFYYEGQMVSEQPIGQFLWFILFDAIHHRGQLTAYLRPMGGKVPAIYGPSADEKQPG